MGLNIQNLNLGESSCLVERVLTHLNFSLEDGPWGGDYELDTGIMFIFS